MDRRARIEQLRAIASTLEPGPRTRDSLRDTVWRYTDRFVENAPHWPAFRATADEGRGILSSPIAEEPIPIDEALELLKAHVDEQGANLASGGYLAFVPPSSLYASALADYLATVTNRYSGSYFGAPGAVRIEHMLLRWMAGFLGYPSTAAGDLTSGGSIANLVGVVTAREAHRLRAADFSRAVVYLSEQAHHSVEKALRIAGLKETIKRYVPLDARFRMRADALDSAIQRDREAGLAPWLIVVVAWRSW